MDNDDTWALTTIQKISTESTEHKAFEDIDVNRVLASTMDVKKDVEVTPP
jgi:hypothetical protein